MLWGCRGEKLCQLVGVIAVACNLAEKLVTIAWPTTILPTEAGQIGGLKDVIHFGVGQAPLHVDESRRHRRPKTLRRHDVQEHHHL